MDYRLFYGQGSASDGIRLVLEEIGVPYKLLQSTIERGKTRPPEQLQINPNGWVQREKNINKLIFFQKLKHQMGYLIYGKVLQ